MLSVSDSKQKTHLQKQVRFFILFFQGPYTAQECSSHVDSPTDLCYTDKKHERSIAMTDFSVVEKNLTAYGY
ncbi:MAG: hypothetical protein IJC43_02270, partial [Clostridia bacterium]|nr:hypothetical protein [Clostridia bacterium]